MSPEATDPRGVGTRVYERLTSQSERGVRELGAEMGEDLASLVVDFCLGQLWERPHLDLRIRSLVLVGALTAMGDTRALRTHVRGALSHGATPAEIREVFILMSGYAGFPRATGAAEVAESEFARLEESEGK